jgi:WD40 repeat protein
VEKKEYLTLVRSHTSSICDISIDSTCQYIATCSLDSTVRVWSFADCRQFYDFSAPNERPTRLTFHPHGLVTSSSSSSQEVNKSSSQIIFACGFDSGKIRVFNVSEGKLYTEIKCPHMTKSSSNETLKHEITDLKYSNDGKRLVSADISRYLCLFNPERDYCLIRILPNTIQSYGSLVISPDDRHLAVIGPSETLISVFDSLTLNESLRINTSCDANASKSDACVRLAYSALNVNQILCVTSANRLLKFDSTSGRLLSSINKIHRSKTDCMFVSSDGRFLATAGDNCVKIWDYEMRLEKNYQVKREFKNWVLFQFFRNGKIP